MLSDQPWQILDVGSIWMKEFASALCRVVPAVCWEPRISAFGVLRRWQRSEQLSNPALLVEQFPLQAGYARQPIASLLRYENRIVARMKGRCERPDDSPLICSTPFYAPIAEIWPGPVAYYATDLTYAYDGLNSEQVKHLDRRICRAATAIFPNTRRIGDYFIEQAGCDPAKITVIPNATRQSNISAAPLLSPGPLPHDIAGLPRPIAGVIGNLGGNMDWLLLREAITLTPGIHWVFVGPATPIRDSAQAEARQAAQRMATFVGAKSYGELQQYARAFDVAVLPYKKKEPTYSGSSTRFYEHLAACRPMISTRGVAELLEKAPLVTLFDTAEELQEAMQSLQERQFRDGLETKRWLASKRATWEERASTLADVFLPSVVHR
jgi:glycosyltransferase involved in cell wall biosynthesis